MYKSSYYNLLIPVPERNETLLCNMLHGGVLALEETEAGIIENLVQATSFELSENHLGYSFLKTLIEKEYIIDTQIDEFDQYKQRRAEFAHTMFTRDEACIGLTIGTTSTCNMACPYCFEFQKNNHNLDGSLIEKVERHIENMITQSSQIKKWKELGVVWYGGEPLIGIDTIKELTPKLLSIADKYQMQYYGSIITNGILLTREAWKVLEECHVVRVQVTLDGIKEIHNKHRPLRNPNALNYEKILENMTKMPEGIKATIRINTDQEVVEHFDEFLNDLYAYGLWPQRYKQIHLAPARIRTYTEAKEDSSSGRISRGKWEFTRMDLMHRMYERFNSWAESVGKKKAKFIFKFPKPKFDECICLISPYVLTIGADGYIYKCWEYIHDQEKRVQYLSEDFQVDKYTDYLNFDKASQCPQSATCKILPICDTTRCVVRNEADCLLKDGDYIEEIKQKYLQVIKINGVI